MTSGKQSGSAQPMPGDQPSSAGGLAGFAAAVASLSATCPITTQGNRRFVRTMGEAYANIRLQDVWRPLRFLKQMAGAPPITFGTREFRGSLVDDANPARHFTAFVFVGFWLPGWLAVITLWLWEAAGYIRYRGEWSPPDLRMGYLGIHHGRQIRRHGHTILATLILRDLGEA